MRMELIRSRQVSKSPDRREGAKGVGTADEEGEGEGGGGLIQGLEIPRRTEYRLYPST